MNGNMLLTLLSYRQAKKKGLTGTDAIKATLLGQNIGGSASIATSYFVTDRLINREVSRLPQDSKVVPRYSYTPSATTLTKAQIKKELLSLKGIMIEAAPEDKREKLEKDYRDAIGEIVSEASSCK